MDEKRLLRHVSGLATDDEVRAAERHLLVCRECRHALVDTATVHRAAARRRTIRRALPLAAAAVLVLAFTAILDREGAPNDPVFRGGQIPGELTAVAPLDNSVVARDSVMFTWMSGGPDAYYALTLTDAEGDVVWSTEVTDTTVRLPGSLQLTGDATYYWFVDAFLEGANSATSGVQEFRAR